jgi:hypothetical protein
MHAACSRCSHGARHEARWVPLPPSSHNSRCLGSDVLLQLHHNAPQALPSDGNVHEDQRVGLHEMVASDQEMRSGEAAGARGESTYALRRDGSTTVMHRSNRIGGAQGRHERHFGPGHVHNALGGCAGCLSHFCCLGCEERLDGKGKEMDTKLR